MRFLQFLKLSALCRRLSDLSRLQFSSTCESLESSPGVCHKALTRFRRGITFVVQAAQTCLFLNILFRVFQIWCKFQITETFLQNSDPRFTAGAAHMWLNSYRRLFHYGQVKVRRQICVIQPTWSVGVKIAPKLCQAGRNLPQQTQSCSAVKSLCKKSFLCV